MKIAFVSDTHLTPRAPAFGENWQAARAWIEAGRPDLVIHLGDIAADGAGDVRELEAARAAFEGLDAECRFLPGNHDIGDNPIAPGVANDHPVDLARLTDFRRIFGPDWWSVETRDWQVVGLNAQLFATDGDDEAAQCDWLAGALGRHRGKLGLVLHKPLFRDDPAEAAPHQRYVPHAARQRLLALLAARELRFVASGHVHQTRSILHRGVEHAWAPSAAYVIPDGHQERIGGKTVGALSLELSDSGHRFAWVTPPGIAQHTILDHPIYPKYAAAGR